MENQFDRIANFVDSLERNVLTEDQQAMLLIGADSADTTKANNCSCYQGNGFCSNNCKWRGANNCDCF